MYCPHQWRICLSASPKFCLLSWYQPKLHDPVSSRRSAEEGVIVPRGLLPPHTIDAANPLASASLSSWFVEDSRPRWHGCRRATLLLRQRLKHRHSSAALVIWPPPAPDLKDSSSMAIISSLSGRRRREFPARRPDDPAGPCYLRAR